jgi:hypothetical protein
MFLSYHIQICQEHFFQKGCWHLLPDVSFEIIIDNDLLKCQDLSKVTTGYSYTNLQKVLTRGAKWTNFSSKVRIHRQCLPDVLLKQAFVIGRLTFGDSVAREEKEITINFICNVGSCLDTLVIQS